MWRISKKPTVFGCFVLKRHDTSIVAQNVDPVCKLLFDDFCCCSDRTEVHKVTINGSDVYFRKLILDCLQGCLGAIRPALAKLQSPRFNDCTSSADLRFSITT